MMLGRARSLAVALLLGSWARVAPAQSAQSTTVIPLQSLSFGLLLPGVRETVQVTDIARRAVVALAGSGAVDVTLVLPTSLEGPDGSSIPLTFGATDAGILPTVASPVMALNPFEVNRVQLSAERAVHFVLGGTALPSRTHRPGHYSARVLVIVSQPGT
jgi:hypothetical protein